MLDDQSELDLGIPVVGGGDTCVDSDSPGLNLTWTRTKLRWAAT